MDLEPLFHVCFVCNGNRVLPGDRPCPLCSETRSHVVSPEGTLVDGGSCDNTASFAGFDIPWDLR
jgi:hypothetical protein